MFSIDIRFSQRVSGMLLALFLSLNLNVLAEEPSNARPTLPQGSLLKSAPHFSQWIVTFSYPQERAVSNSQAKASSINPSLPRKIVTTITDKIIHEEIFTVGLAKIDRYQVGRIIYSKLPNVAFWTMYNPDEQKNTPVQDRSLSPLPENGFRGLDWISDRTYVGTLNQGKISYLAFAPLNVENVDFKSLTALSTFACIDADTRMPALVGENGVVRTFSFLPPPTTVQNLPVDLMKDIKEGEAIRAKFNTAPAKEY